MSEYSNAYGMSADSPEQSNDLNSSDEQFNITHRNNSDLLDNLTISNILNSTSSSDLSVQPLLTVNYRTWLRDSHELYDYESQSLKSGQHIVHGSCRLVRNDIEVTPVNLRHRPVGESLDLLLCVKARQNRYYLFPADIHLAYPNGYIPRKMWLVTKYLDQGLYALREGDVLKLGRFKLRVRKIVPDTPGNTAESQANSSVFLAKILSSFFSNNGTEDGANDINYDEKVPENAQCRFCLTGENEQHNPMIKACKCKGSIMYIHLKCLQSWIHGRLNITEFLVERSSAFVKKVACELCRTEFPPYITKDGKQYPLLSLPNIEPPYIIFENFGVLNSKGLHVCSLAVRKECKLGRGHDSDLRVADVSISRWHATIKYVDGDFLLEDHDSKFGTLVAMRRPVILDVQNRITLQIGRSVLDFEVT